MTRSAWLSTSLAATLLFGAASGYAQFRTSVQGSVTDPTGAAIPGATLTLKDTANNQTIEHQSDASGVFNFNALPADHFTLTVKAPGFTTKVLSDLQFIPEQANSVNVQLVVGATDTTVTVDASTTPAMDTETSNIGGTISANDIQHTPSFNRDVFTLSQLIPGVISDGSQGSGGGVYGVPGNQGPGGSGNGGAAPTENGPQVQANGGQYGSNSISLDGISTVSAVWGGTTIITPTEESIDNVRIVSNDYDAENGRFSGAQTMVTTKSGTNQLHGSAFLAIHRPGMNAYQRPLYYAAGNVSGAAAGSTANSPLRDNARFNQYGGSLGGPIWKDKMFAFFAYEASPNSSNSTSNGWYETAAFRSSTTQGPIAKQYNTFTGAAPIGTLATSTQTCASVGLVEGVNCRTISGQGLDIGSPVTTGVGKQDLTATGTASNPGVGGGLDGVADVGYYSTSVPTTSYYRQYAGRYDWNATTRDRLSFTIYWVPQGNSSYNGGARGYDKFNHNQVNEAMAVIWNHTFSPTFLNEARANAAGWHWNEITDNPQEPVGFPQDNITFFAPSASLNQFGTSLGSNYNQWTYTYKDTATKIARSHTLKFGGELTALHYLNNPIGRPTYGFYNIWDFQNDAPYQESGSFNSVTGKPGGVRTDDREYLFGAFLQDSYKVKPNLTLNAGIRYSYLGPLYAKQNNLPHVVLGTGSTTYTGMSIAQGGNLWNAQKGNFGPQVGFNWAPTVFQNKLVVRGGYGLSFNQEEIAITANSGYNPPTANYVSYAFASPSNPGTNGGAIVYGISSSANSLNGYASNPNTITSYNSANLPTAGNANIIIVGDGHGNLPTSYTEHYSLNTDYELNRELVLSAAYQGSLGRHLINHETPNAPAVAAGYALNPLVTSGDFWTNEGSSNNNALLLEAKHPLVHHLSLDAQFMWAKSMDTDGSGPYYEDPYFPENALYSYGRSDYNIGKSFKAFGLWQPVIWHGDHAWMEKIVGGWSLSGIFNWHTGFPYSPTYGISQSLYCSQCGYYNLRPYYNGTGGKDHSNKAFVNGTNFTGITSTQNQTTATVNGSANTVTSYSNKFFSVPNYQAAMQATSGTGFPNPNQALPPRPGLGRNAFTGPGYHDVDASLAKNFGIPNNRITGEHAGLEIRADAFNLFNIANLNPQSVSNNVTAANFGQDTGELGGRTITLQARFSF